MKKVASDTLRRCDGEMKFFNDNINTLERYSNDKFVLEQDLADILEAIREKDY